MEIKNLKKCIKKLEAAIKATEQARIMEEKEFTKFKKIFDIKEPWPKQASLNYIKIKLADQLLEDNVR